MFLYDTTQSGPVSQFAEVLKVGNSSQFQVNHIVGPVTFAAKSQHNLVSFTTWLVLVKQTIFQLLSPEQVLVANLTRIASVLPGDSLEVIEQDPIFLL